MRTFLAVRPPPDAISHLAARLPSPPVASERWHVTLVFLGEVPAPVRLVDDLTAVCDRHRPLELGLAGSGVFGRGGPVWVGLDGDVVGLGALAADLTRSCRAAGVDVERQRFRPHLTVGRRGRPDPRSLETYAGPTWTADEVELVVSHLGRSVTHEVLRHLPLAA